MQTIEIKYDCWFPIFLIDYVYTCNKEGSNDPSVKRIKNAIISRPLPTLKRGFISFHHLCGHDNTTSSGIPSNCSVTLNKDRHQEELYVSSSEKKNRSLIYSVPESRLINDGSIASKTDWFLEYQPLPVVDRNEKIVLEAEFDAKYGGFGADNIHFHTPQRLILSLKTCITSINHIPLKRNWYILIHFLSYH